MTIYTLRYEDDGLGVEKRVEFEADSPARALLIAQAEAEGRWAELCADGQPICRVGRESTGAGDYWVIRSRPKGRGSPENAAPNDRLDDPRGRAPESRLVVP